MPGDTVVEEEVYGCPSDWGGDFQTIRQLSRSCRGEVERALGTVEMPTPSAESALSPAEILVLNSVEAAQSVGGAAEKGSDPGGLLKVSLAGERDYQWMGTPAPGKKDTSAARRLLRALRPLAQRALREDGVEEAGSGNDDAESDDE